MLLFFDPPRLAFIGNTQITFVPGLSEKVQSLLDTKDDASSLNKNKRKRDITRKQVSIVVFFNAMSVRG